MNRDQNQADIEGSSCWVKEAEKWGWGEDRGENVM